MTLAGAKFIVIFIFLFLLIAKVNTIDVFAVTAPDFPACSNPPGTLRVENTGIHGVAGNVSEYKGKDIVYDVNGDQILQCLCTEDGEGIQTNWWKVSSLNDSDIQTLRNQGWHYIADGSLWGLDSRPYMARNSEYACNGGDGTGEVLGTSIEDILGLAATGGKLKTFSMLGAGIGTVLLFLGFYLLRKKHSS